MPRLPNLIAILSSRWFGPGAIAVLAALMACLMLDPAGDYAQRAEGPGLTLDEIFNAQIGVEIADPLLGGNFEKAIKATRTLPDHPPLGRLWLGLAHEIVVFVDPPGGQHSRIVVACARVGSAVAFGLLIFLIGYVSALWHGRLAGWGTSLSILLMPRVFGHAHLAALETVLNLAYAAALLSIACWWKPNSSAQSSAHPPPGFRVLVVCGIVFGLVLLTKIQAIFLPIPIVFWAVWNWRWRGLWQCVVWGVAGLLVFFAGWPWLWLDPIGNVLKYLGQTNKRPVIYVWYLGQQFADRDVPWHYPWVLFATTVPVGLQVLGFFGLWWSKNEETSGQATNSLLRHISGWIGARETLVLAGILFPLTVFSLPSVAVYDGERLFSVVFPIWAMFIGRGLTMAHEWVAKRSSPQLSGMILAGFLSCQSLGLVQFAPCWLSYYNGLVGGLHGAESLGFQTTYWGDSVTRELLLKVAQHVPADSTIDMLPVQHPFQLQALESQCPVFRDKQIMLRAFDERAAEPAKYLLVFHRRDYWPHDWSGEPPPYKYIVGIHRQGTLLAGLYERN